jgi:hypothetical protein
VTRPLACLVPALVLVLAPGCVVRYEFPAEEVRKLDGFDARKAPAPEVTLVSRKGARQVVTPVTELTLLQDGSSDRPVRWSRFTVTGERLVAEPAAGGHPTSVPIEALRGLAIERASPGRTAALLGSAALVAGFGLTLGALSDPALRNSGDLSAALLSLTLEIAGCVGLLASLGLGWDVDAD